MKTKLIVIAMAMIALLLLSGCGQQATTATTAQKPSKAVVKIGITAPLTGPVAFLGEGMVNALELAKEDLGETKYEYKFILEDDAMEPKKVSTSTQKLINLDNVDAIVSASSGSGNVVTPMAQEAKVIHFGIGSDANIAEGEYNHIHWTPPSEETKAWVAEAQKRGIKKIAELYVNQQGAVAIIEQLKADLTPEMEVVFEEATNFGDLDFKAVLMRAEKSEPDVLLVHYFSPEAEAVMKQIKELGIEIPISSIESPELCDHPEVFEGAWYANAADPTADFSGRYEARAGKNPPLASANTYDIIRFLVKGFEEAGADPAVKPSNEAVLAKLNGMELDGAMGHAKIDGGIVSTKAVIRTIKDGKPVTLSGAQ